MISYNPGHWFAFVFKIHKAETFRQLFPLMCLLAVYSFFIDYMMVYFFHTTAKSRISGLSIIYSVLGFVISLLLVFRTNTAYERWWEGRRLWGTLVNASRNLAMGIRVMGNPDDIRFFRQLIPEYAEALRKHLQREIKPESEQTENQTPQVQHIPNDLALQAWKRINSMELKEGQLIALNAQCQQLTEVCGACERIRNTPIPVSYSMFIKKFLFFYIMFMPFAYVGALGYFVIPLVVFIFYILASIEIIAEEIENPFGKDKNDLPLKTICTGIKQTTLEILRD